MSRPDTIRQPSPLSRQLIGQPPTPPWYCEHLWRWKGKVYFKTAPTLRATTVATLFAFAGFSYEEIKIVYPILTDDMIRAALAWFEDEGAEDV